MEATSHEATVTLTQRLHDPDTAADPGFVARALSDRDELVAEVQAGLRG